MRKLLLIPILFFSCDGKPDLDIIPEEPAELLTQEKFTEVMVDAHLLEATLKLKLIRKPDIKKRIPSFYQQVFEKHDITESVFKANFEFYSSQKQVLIDIYDSVEVRLRRMKDTLEKPPLNLKDSSILNAPDTAQKKLLNSSQLEKPF